MAVAVLAVAAPAAGAAPSWQRPIDVSAPDETADSALVAMNLAGDTAVAWVRDGTHVRAAMRRAGGGFSAPQDVSREVDGKIVNYPVLAIDGAGNAIVAWQLDDDFGQARTLLQAAVLPADGRFQRPVTVSAGGDDVFGADVAMRPAGDAIVTWTRETSSGDVVQASRRPPGGSFSKPVDVSAVGRDVFFSAVAMNPAGDVIVAWPFATAKSHVVQAALSPAGGTFSKPVSLSVPGQDALAARVAIDPAGNTVVTWNRSNGETLVAQAAFGAARGPFSMAVDLSEPGRDGLFADPAIDARGNALITWSYEDLFADRTNGVVQMSTRSAAGALSPPVDLSRAGYGAEYPSVAMSPSGAAIAVWTAEAKDPLNSAGVQAALRAPGGPFSAPIDLAPTKRRVTGPQVAIDEAGNGIVVWTNVTNPDGGTVRARVYQERDLPRPPAAPSVTGLRLGPSRFHAARSGPPFRELGGRGGTRVSYSLNVAARVRFTVERGVVGRSVGGRCAKPTRANRRHGHCTRFVHVAGSFARDRPAGSDRFAFMGRLAGRRLKLGGYRLVAVPTAGALRGAPARARFRIVR